jgi:cell division protease FtsH
MFTQNGMGDALGLRVASSTDKELVIGPEQQAAVDNEVKDLLESEYARARNILEEESASLELLAETLLVEETLDRERFLALLSEAGGLHQSASTPASAA